MTLSRKSLLIHLHGPMKAIDSACDGQPTAVDESREGHRRPRFRIIGRLQESLDATIAELSLTGVANPDEIVEIDTDLIDAFPLRYACLLGIDTIVAAFKDKKMEKLSAILVRPHPEKSGRYQIAYGHQRLQAAIARGTKVLAIIQQISDSEMAAAAARHM